MSWTNGDLLTPANLNNKGPKFNVKDSVYGALGDGSTDDTAAFTAAGIAANAAGGTVYVPNGIYRINSWVNSSISNLAVEGESKYGTILKRINGSGTINTRMLWFRDAAAGAKLSIRNLTLHGNRSSYSGQGGNSHSIDINPQRSLGFDFVMLDDIHLVEFAVSGIALQGGSGISSRAVILRNITSDTGDAGGQDAIRVTMGFDVLIYNNIAVHSMEAELNGVDTACRYILLGNNIDTGSGRWKYNLDSTIIAALKPYALINTLSTADLENLCDNSYGDFHNVLLYINAEISPARGGFKIHGGRIIAAAGGTSANAFGPAGSTCPEHMEFHKVEFSDERTGSNVQAWLGLDINNAAGRRVVFNDCRSTSSSARFAAHRQIDIDMINCWSALDPAIRDGLLFGNNQNSASHKTAYFKVHGNTTSNRSTVLCRTSQGQGYYSTYDFAGNSSLPGYMLALDNTNVLRAPWGSNLTGGVGFSQLQDFTETSDISLNAAGYPSMGTHIKGMRLNWADPTSRNSYTGAICYATGAPGSFVSFGAVGT